MSLRAVVVSETAFIAIGDLATVITEYADAVEADDPSAAAPLREVVGALLDYELQTMEGHDRAG